MMMRLSFSSISGRGKAPEVLIDSGVYVSLSQCPELMNIHKLVEASTRRAPATTKTISKLKKQLLSAFFFCRPHPIHVLIEA